MCRWLAYSGSPIPLETFVSKPANSLIHQSSAAAMGATALNGDGFGVGWYSPGDPVPALFRSVQPAWADTNLGELARHIRSSLFLAHVRASTGTPVQQTNCHPFRHGQWMWAHNGAIREFATVRRDLLCAVDPALFSGLAGSTDSEVMFYLALTFGLGQDPVAAVERMVGFVEEVGTLQGVQWPIQMTAVTTDGQRLWVFRYSSEGRSRTLFWTTRVSTLRQLHPEVPQLQELSEETRLVVSEPLSDLPGSGSRYRSPPPASFSRARTFWTPSTRPGPERPRADPDRRRPPRRAPPGSSHRHDRRRCRAPRHVPIGRPVAQPPRPGTGPPRRAQSGALPQSGGRHPKRMVLLPCRRDSRTHRRQGSGTCPRPW